MKIFLRLLVLSAVCAAFCFAPKLFAQSQPSPDGQPTPSGSKTPAKKVWTNENISSVRGNISVVGGPSSASSRSGRRSGSTSNGATFVDPKEGQIVHPGETIHIDLNVDSDITPVKAVGIISHIGTSDNFREGPPYSFTFTIPEKEIKGSNSRLIGFQELTLFGTVVGRKDYELATTTVDVEEDELPVSIVATSTAMSQWDRIPNHLNFSEAGQHEEIDINAKFPNGHQLDVTESTNTTLSSENPSVVEVSDDGGLTAIGPGQTRIIATYSMGGQQKTCYVSVTVEGASAGRTITGEQLSTNRLIASPANFNFGDVPTNASGSQVQVTITNNTRVDVLIYQIKAQDFRLKSESCSNTTLPPGGSCIITATFAPTRPGDVHGYIFVPNSATILSVPLFGRGT